jgi:cytochrome c peroxidase
MTARILTWSFAITLIGGGLASGQDLTPMEQLGKSIFFDTNLSINQNQSCAACHDPAAGWTGPDSDINATGAVYEGSIAGRFGNRKPPSSAYATVSPIFHFVIDQQEALFIGGNFWDGRATGERLGNPAADQAQGPFLNPVEQASPDNACIVYRVCTADSYPVSFDEVWPGSCDIDWPADIEDICGQEDVMVMLSPEDRAKVAMAYDNIALSIAAFEASAESNAFTSKYDQSKGGKAKLTQQERRGFALFQGKGKCKNCHLSAGQNPLFTDFTFDNLGIPKNPDNPFYGMPPEFNPDGPDWIDPGLGGFLETRPEYAEYAEENHGKHKVPTLRNVDLRPDGGFVKAFGHNGYFKSLEEIVHFYNTRDVLPLCEDTADPEPGVNCWPAPEVPENVNTDELGDLGLTAEEEAAIVAFMRTLSDGYQGTQAAWYADYLGLTPEEEALIFAR